MNDEALLSLLKSVVWATAFVVSVGILAPILRFWIHSFVALHEKEHRAKRAGNREHAAAR